MKTICKYLFIVATVLFTATVSAQTHSCCVKPSTTEFAMLGSDESFMASHLAPLPFNYVASHGGHMVTFKTADGKTGSAFEVKGHNPTNNYLFVIHEWWGLNDYIKRESENLMHELDVNVIALDLYDGKIATNADSAGKLMGEAKDERIRAIIKGAFDYAGPQSKIQIMGWCFGGGWSLQTAIMAGNQATGCVMYYGMPEKDAQKIKSLQAPVLGIFALQDKWITKEVAEQFEKDMKANNKEVTIKLFDADHAFANPSNPKHDKAATDEAHKLAIDFLRKHY